ncbi:hypothetical protein Sme01_09500 [Sphaerisporangium melleum]|uniref:Sulfotransferase n=1 Tax=Sphaerisporangium melleum TaxID=321316 RepID=A0A917QT84_9ACTN|nr:sulfotransferase [Sphaerisporangium melleum]GGK67449.1 hypothetical protein GCM10007964_08110 [Sphaerisporangium melleum]GII68474.1 hypothetical protein Sme01_09500 [Sphaerisporangium melleum]
MDHSPVATMSRPGAPHRPASGEPELGFVLGTGRCGSTLLYDVLARHPGVGFPTNLDDRLPGVPPRVRRLAAAVYRRCPPEFPRRRVRPSEVQAALAREVSPAIVDPFRELVAADASPWLARRLTAFYRRRAADQAVTRYVHKFTGWPRAGLLHEVFPQARFVHIVRDGRAVVNSWLQMWWWRGHLGPSGWHYGPLPPAYAREWEREGHSLVHLAAIGWKLLMDAYDAAAASVPPHLWLEVRYEDLVADPRERFGEILDFLGLPWSPAFERGFARHAFRTGRVDAFRRDLTPGQIALLNRSLGAHLAARGYAPDRDG